MVCGELYPRCAIQLPMFNERAVCQAAIDSACEQTWPKGRLFVQVRLLFAARALLPRYPRSMLVSGLNRVGPYGGVFTQQR